MEKACRGSPQISERGSQKQRRSVDAASLPGHAAVSSFCYVLDLGSASVWDYLDAQSASNTLQACPDMLSREFIDTVSLKAVENFAAEHKTHLGRRCECDWLRRLDFHYHDKDRCKGVALFSVNKTLPILQLPGGAKALLDALLLTKKLIQPFEAAENSRTATFDPIVCPLVTKEIPNLPTKAAVTRAMNEISPGAGSRIYYQFKLNTKPSYADFLEEHWAGMDGSSCTYCDSLTDPDEVLIEKHTNLRVGRIRVNCTELYQPLKTALEKNLGFVRFVRRPRRHSRREWRMIGKYKGLVAGPTEGGILCGLFLVNGFQSRV